MASTHYTFCRICEATCGLPFDVEDDCIDVGILIELRKAPGAEAGEDRYETPDGRRRARERRETA